MLHNRLERDDDSKITTLERRPRSCKELRGRHGLLRGCAERATALEAH